MSKQDTYAPSKPDPHPMDRLDPLEARMLHEAKLVYDDLFGPEENPPKTPFTMHLARTFPLSEGKGPL